MKPTTRAWRFMLVGDVGGQSTFHLGDEAMLQANIERLKSLYPGAEITVASHDPMWTAKEYDVKAIPRVELIETLAGSESPDGVTMELVSKTYEAFVNMDGALPESVPETTVRALADADGLLISGGGNLNASWAEQLYERIFLIELAHRFGCRIVVSGQTLGPHLGPSERRALRNTLALARLVSVRECYSMRVAAAIGLSSGRTTLHLDDAFFLPRGLNGTAETDRIVKDDWIAVTVTRFKGSPESFAGQLSRIARHTGCRLVFIPHVKAPDNDWEVADDVVELLDPDVSAEVLDVPSLTRGRWLVEHAALVVSMRYHPLVFAVAGRVPAVGVYTDEYTRVKLRGALGHAGLEDCVVSLEWALGGALIELVRSVWERRIPIKQHLTSLESHWWNRESAYRTRLWQALAGVEPESTNFRAPGAGRADWSNEAGFGSHCPHGQWSKRASDLEKRRDEWFRERVELLKQVDSAIEYAKNLEDILKARDRQIDGLNELEAEQDQWARERSRLHERVKSASEYAKSLEATLRERDREISDLKALIPSLRTTTDEEG